MEYRASHEYRIRTTSTLLVDVNGARHALTPDIQVSVQFIPQKLTLCETFVLLGCQTAADIRQCLLPFADNEEPLAYVALVHALVDTHFPTTPSQADVLAHINVERDKLKTPYPTPNPPPPPAPAVDPAVALASVLALFDMEFLPFAEFNTVSKPTYFGVLVRELLRVYLGLAAEDIRDTVVRTLFFYCHIKHK
jgi:hypothetical protein